MHLKDSSGGQIAARMTAWMNKGAGGRELMKHDFPVVCIICSLAAIQIPQLLVTVAQRRGVRTNPCGKLAPISVQRRDGKALPVLDHTFFLAKTLCNVAILLRKLLILSQKFSLYISKDSACPGGRELSCM